MARRSLGVWTRQLVGGNHKNKLCATPLGGLILDLHHRNSLQTQTQIQTLTVPSSPQTIRNWNYSPNLNFLQHRHHLHSDTRTQSAPVKGAGPIPDFPNAFVIKDGRTCYDAVKQIEDERLSAIFFFTKRLHTFSPLYVSRDPILRALCALYQHRTIYCVCLYQTGGSDTLHTLGVYKTPSFHFYLKGEKVDELTKPSIDRLRKTLENVYNPSGMKKRKSRAREENEQMDVSQLVEVLPSRFAASSYPKVIEAVESLPEVDHVHRKIWCFAKGLFLSQEKREMFAKVEDDVAKLQWPHREMAAEE